MKKFVLILAILLTFVQTSYAVEKTPLFKAGIFNNDIRGVKSVLNAQVRYANKTDFDKFISTYDKDYLNDDGFNIQNYSNLVKELWNTYGNIKYGIKIHDIKIDAKNKAMVSLTESSSAYIPLTKSMGGVLKSEANSVYYLKKTDGKWRVISDKVIDESTSMMYGDAMNLDVKLTAPKTVSPKEEYTASLEFEPPKDTFVIASIAKDVVTYPQVEAKEVFRRLPEDNILERLFIANSENKNEYVMASIGITKANICDMNLKLSLTGFGYQIIRVNVDSDKKEENNDKIE